MSTEVRPRHWRDSNDYRREYFKRNKGLLHFIWICAYCKRPLIGKGSVEVDHVVPPSIFAEKKYDSEGRLVSNDSLLSRFANHNFNLVSSCKKCNREKSDKVGTITALGVTAKVMEVPLYTAQNIAFILLGFALTKSYDVTRFGFRLLFKPLRAKTPWKQKLLIIAIYVAFFYYIWKRLTG